ncbi:thermonuclease family protein [Hyphomonas sp. WL0036]|uniref:thermonuclease family protein n=1 Tax=Hyphomonas sediminis TaxID=2866160 RepID=UPI001C82577C|nr:thermonuclease family protein [Hyphomonas sediminis]MBY9066164.1 thermonuclease family protein [Hyphomonas sediminis]
MARKAGVLEFRRPKRRAVLIPGIQRTNKLRFGRRRPMSVPRQLLILAIAPLGLLAVVAMTERQASLRDPVPEVTAHPSAARHAVSWVDGDSGRIGEVRFRLYGVDAPEGSPSKAYCDLEQRRAIGARLAARTLTNQGNVRIEEMGMDRYGRLLVRLSVAGEDVASKLVAQGHLKTWDYDAGETKPDWCS